MKPQSLVRAMRTSIVIVALSVLTACGAISAVNDAAKALDVYELRAPSDIEATRRSPLPIDVIVELPTTGGSLATDRIMIRPDRLQAQYLPEVRWSEPTPIMVQTLMLRSIEATGAVRYVGRTPLGVSGDYAIVTEIIDFQAEVADDSETANVRVQLIVRLVRERDARIVASRTFTSTAGAASTETRPLIEAFNDATDEIMIEFASWIQSALGRR